MFKTLKKLIEKHFYADRETAEVKIDTCFAMGKITDGQYSDLYILLDEYYPQAEAEEETSEEEA